MFLLGGISIPWAVGWYIYYKTKHKLNFLTKTTIDLPIEDVIPGMVLKNDHFMKGLKQNEIDALKHQGFVSLSVKNPLPFIPVIFIAMLLFPLFSSFF
jgi:hypothetical protein